MVLLLDKTIIINYRVCKFIYFLYNFSLKIVSFTLRMEGEQLTEIEVEANRGKDNYTSGDYKCYACSYSTNSQKQLKTHLSKTHSNVDVTLPKKCAFRYVKNCKDKFNLFKLFDILQGTYNFYTYLLFFNHRVQKRQEDYQAAIFV